MRTSLQELHARLGDDDHLRHARPGRGDDARAPRRGDARRPHPAGRRAAAAVRRPANLFVAAFIGSPAMNLVRARRSKATRSCSGSSGSACRKSPSGRAGRPRSSSAIRPEAFEDPCVREAGLPRIEVTVQVIEELGADAHLFFEVDASRSSSRQARQTTKTRTRHSSIATRPRAVHGARRPTDERAHRRHRAVRRSRAALLLFARDG